MNELFSTNPEDLTDAQVDKIVLALEQDRERFLKSEAEPKAPRKAAKVDANPNLNLDDLGL